MQWGDCVPDDVPERGSESTRHSLPEDHKTASSEPGEGALVYAGSGPWLWATSKDGMFYLSPALSKTCPSDLQSENPVVLPCALPDLSNHVAVDHFNDCMLGMAESKHRNAGWFVGRHKSRAGVRPRVYLPAMLKVIDVCMFTVLKLHDRITLEVTAYVLHLAASIKRTVPARLLEQEIPFVRVKEACAFGAALCSADSQVAKRLRADAAASELRCVRVGVRVLCSVDLAAYAGNMAECLQLAKRLVASMSENAVPAKPDGAGATGRSKPRKGRGAVDERSDSSGESGYEGDVLY